MRKTHKRFLLKSKVHLGIIGTLIVFSLYSLSVLKSLHGFREDLRRNEATIRSELSLLTDTKATSMRSLTTQSYRRVTKSMAEMPKLPEINDHLLFFNTIPYTGSEMLGLLLQWLQGWNGFRHIKLKNTPKRSYTWVQQADLINEVIDTMKAKAVPLSFEQRHMYFVNFTSFGYQSPTYVNIVRDPFDKFIARYKHELQLYSNSTKIIRLKNLSQLIEKCLKSGEADCSSGNGPLFDLTIPYFCGQNVNCLRINSQWALNEAKANVEKFYPVVGVLEETNATLEVLEHNLPFFFKGAQDKYYKQMLMKNRSVLFKKPQKREAKDNIKKYFQTRFALEYEFYNWLRTRLFNQLQMFSSHSH